MTSIRGLLLVLVAALAGCAPTVGGADCTGYPDAPVCTRTGGGCTAVADQVARTPYYDDATGAPAYGGQALLIENCASCHAATTSFGAPQGLDLDVRIVTALGADARAPTEHLHAAQTVSHRMRDDVYAQVVGGLMPPRGYVPTATVFHDLAGHPLPGIQDPVGQEILRVWLACGSPIVERTELLSCGTGADCPVTGECSAGTCVGIGDAVPAHGGVDCTTPMPTWPWLFGCVVARSCAGVACHLGGAGGGLSLGTDAHSAFAALVNAGPSPTGSCTAGPAYVLPGNASGSLLVHKLEGRDAGGTAVCGSPMPLGVALSAAQITAVRDWITAGALEM